MAKQNPETRQKIIDAAREIFLKKGYREARISEIADLANIAPATIYSYFLGKRELFDELRLESVEHVRPEFERKRAAILEEAYTLFGERGFHGTTMEKLAKRTGYSTAGLYQFFSSKEELFSAVIYQTPFLEAMAHHSTELNQYETLEEALNKIGMSYINMFNTSRRAALTRLVIAESVNYPEIGNIYHQHGVGFVAKSVEDCLRKYNYHVTRKDIDISLAARTYVGSLLSYAIMFKVVPGVQNSPPSDESLVKLLVTLFLDGLRPRE